jgi:hypothetical protein
MKELVAEIVALNKLWITTAGLLGERADFHKASLKGADFSHSNLEGANFERAYIPLANFDEANFTGDSFKNAIFMKTELMEFMFQQETKRKKVDPESALPSSAAKKRPPRARPRPRLRLVKPLSSDKASKE